MRQPSEFAAMMALYAAVMDIKVWRGIEYMELRLYGLMATEVGKRGCESGRLAARARRETAQHLARILCGVARVSSR